MPMFKIEQYELHTQTYQVEAQDEAQAIAKLLKGEAEPVDDSLEYVEVAEDFGLPAEECRDLADELRDHGVPVDAVIPSIRSIEEVE